MTRILSLGQNNGLTIMILNLAPVRSYHLDTLSSLNFANRTKKIEINDVENEPYLRMAPKGTAASITGPSIKRQPLRPLNGTTHNRQPETDEKSGKPTKTFSVYSDQSKPVRRSVISGPGRKAEAPRPAADTHGCLQGHAALKTIHRQFPEGPEYSAERINQLVEQRVDAILAARGLSNEQTAVAAVSDRSVNTEMQSRLSRLEQLVEKHEDGRAREGLQYLFSARQHQARGEDALALEQYKHALPFFPNMEKLPRKILALQKKIDSAKSDATVAGRTAHGTAPRTSHALTQKLPALEPVPEVPPARRRKRVCTDTEGTDEDGDYNESYEKEEYSDEDELVQARARSPRKQKVHVIREVSHTTSTSSYSLPSSNGFHSPRTSHLLNIINSRDISQIRLLRGVGAKKAEAIVRCLCELDEQENAQRDSDAAITELGQLGGLRGVGMKTVERMREGIDVA